MNFKRYLSIGLVIILLGTFFAALSVPNITAAPPSSGDWTIDASMTDTVSDQNIQMTGNITVNALGTLTLKNCTITFMLQYDDQFGIIIHTGATVLLENCVIKSNNTNYRYGFLIDSDSSAQLKWCTISDVHDGILVYSNVATISGCTVFNSDDGIEIVDCGPTVTQNRIHGNSHRGIYIRSNPPTESDPPIQQNLIYDNGMYGIYISNSAPYIYDNTIWNNWDPGIRVQDCDGVFQISNNRIRYNQGQGIHIERSQPIISQNTIEANYDNGIYVSGDSGTGSTPIINSNTIIGNGGSGIYLYNEYCTGVQIDDNSLYNNLNWGIYARGGDFTRSGNVFLDSQGIGNRWGRVMQLWRLQVHETTSNDAGFYLFNDDLWTSPVFSGNGRISHDFGYRGEYEVQNDGTQVVYRNYYVIADDTGGPDQDFAQVSLTDNVDIGMTLVGAPEVDIYDNGGNFAYSNSNPNVGDTVTVTVEVVNVGTAVATNVEVDIYLRYPDGDYKFHERVVAVSIPTGSYPANMVQVTTDITFTSGGWYDITAIADPDNEIWEDDDTDGNPWQQTRTESIYADGYSAFIDYVEAYTDHPYWDWRSMSEQDSASTDPGQWRSFYVMAAKFSGNPDSLHIVETHNPSWDVVVTRSGSSSGSAINYLSTGGGTDYEAFYIHVRPPADAARGSNLGMDLKLESDNLTTAFESYHLDCYANWVIPDGTTETASGETFANVEYGVKVYGTLNLNNVDWAFNNYPDQKEIYVYDGGFADFDDVTLGSTSTTSDWRFYVYGDLDLTNSDISGTDYGVEVYSMDYPANVFIDNNKIHDNSHDGVVIEESYVVVTNNEIYNNGDAGIDGYDSFGGALIQNNDIHNNNDEGIRIQLRSDNKVRVINNSLYRNGEGLVIDSFSNVYTYNNLIYSNTYGIQVFNHGDLESHSDTVKMQSHDGLHMDTYGTGSITDMTSNYNGRAGIWMLYNSELSIYTSQIENNGQFSLYCVNSDVDAWDSRLQSTSLHGAYNGDDDISLDNGATLVATNVSLDRSRLYLNDDESMLTVQWYLQVQTVDMDDVGYSDIQVDVEDGQADQVFSGLTEDEGFTPVIITKEVTIKSTGMTSFMFHKITVSNGVDIERDIVLTGNSLQIIQLNYATRVMSLQMGYVDLPLTTLIYNLTVTNIGMLEETFDVSVMGNLSWKATLSNDTIVLGSGESGNLSLTVTIPQRTLAWTNETFVVTAASQIDPDSTSSVSVFAKALAVKKANVVPVHETFNATPGMDLHSVFEVTNDGNVDDTFTFFASVLGTRMTDPVMTVEPETYDILPFETILVIVNTSVPNGTLVGIDQLTFTAESTAIDASAEATVSFIIDQVFEVKIVHPDVIDIVAGDADTYMLNLTNVGNGPDILTLYSDSEYLSFDVDLVALQPSEETTFDMTVTIPLEMDNTSETVHILAQSADNLTVHTFELELNISKRIRAVEVQTPFDTIELEQGFLKVFDVTLFNDGNTLEVPVLSFSGVTWEGGFDDESLIVLMNGTNSTRFSIQVPEDAATGAVTITFSANYSARTAEKTVTLNIIEKDEELTWSAIDTPNPVTRGEYRIIELTLTNTGNYTVTAVLAALDAKSLATLDQYEVTLEPGQSTVIVLKINFPEGHEAGEYGIAVTATYGATDREASTAVLIDVEQRSYAGMIAMFIILFLLGLVIGIILLFLAAKQGVLPGIGKQEEKKDDGPKPKAKKKVKKKKTAEGEEGEVPLDEDGMPLDIGDLPPGVTVGEDGELSYSEEEQMPMDDAMGGPGELDEDSTGTEEGGEEEEELPEMDLKDEIAALVEEEGVTEAVEEEMEAIDELEADIQAMMHEEQAEMQELSEMEPVPEEATEETSDFDVTLPDDDDL